MSTNPFEQWLAMYAPRTVVWRPWWQRATEDVGAVGFYRCDGAGCFPGYKDPSVALAEFDLAHPLHAPPPMVGQVWAATHGRVDDVVSRVEHVIDGGWELWWGGGAHSYTGSIEAGTEAVRLGYYGWQNMEPWPNPRVVLVAGPTPYGRDVPWAPPGWKP